MIIYTWLITVFWFIFFIVWMSSAFTAKRNARFNLPGIYIRIGIFFVLVVLLRFGAFDQISSGEFAPTSNPLIASLGVALCGIGIALAIWARFYLGRNWGMPMSVKINPELVTTGPYAYVRHPIYTGMLLAIFGTAIAISLLWLIIFVIAGTYFIYSATREEKLMAQTFPDTYPAYKARTKMLIPFVF